MLKSPEQQPSPSKEFIHHTPSNNPSPNQEPKMDLEYPYKSSPPKITKNENFETSLQQIKKADNSSLVFIADYDETFTKKFVNNVHTPSSFGIIDQSTLVSDSSREQCKINSDHLRKYESDLTIDLK